MKRIIFIIIVCLTLSVFVIHNSKAADELITCDSEPTDMTIGFGDIVGCQITPAGESDFFRFDGTSGEIIVLNLLDLSSGCGGSFNRPCPVAQIYAPSDTSFSDPIVTLGAGTDTEIIELPETGTYTIRITEAGNNQTESYRIALERLFPASPSALAIEYGLPISDTITPAPDNDFFLFAGGDDDIISLTLTDLSSGCGGSFNRPCPVAQLYNPSREMILTLGAGTESEIISLVENGTYTVHLTEAGNNQSESYNLSLECLSIEGCGPLSPFADVPPSHPRFDDIIAIYKAGITTGCAQNPLRFCPQDPVTRAQMAAFIIRALEGEPTTDCDPNDPPFPDVDPNLPVCKYIKRLSELDITTGFSDGTYRPANLVTRAQMAIFIIRALEGDPPNNLCATRSPFPDVAANSPTCKYIKRFFELGITTGFSDGTYRPNITITRAQMAAFLARAFLNTD